MWSDMRPRAHEHETCFENVELGDRIPTCEHGPFTIVDGVRWAGFHENWMRMHYDRDYAQTERGLQTFIASGAYRQALLVYSVTDWIGPRGVLRTLSLRHVFPTYEGDLMRLSGIVTEKASTAGETWIRCDLEGRNQNDRQIMSGWCIIVLPSCADRGGL